MTELVGLEQRYRQLLAWYPPAFRHEQGDEMLGVLMAGARPGQRRPGLGESADLIKSAVILRLRRIGSPADSKRWTDALALFSLVAPLLLVAAAVLEVAVPYSLPAPSPKYPRPLPPYLASRQIGGLSLLSWPPFDITLGCLAVVAVLVLLGQRWAAIAAMTGTAVFWIAADQIPLPFPLQVFTIAVCLLTGAALVASPGPRRGRELVNWRHWIVLLLTAAAVQVASLMYDASSVFAQEAYADASPIRQATRTGRSTTIAFYHVLSPNVIGYVIAAAALTVITIGLAVAWKQGWYYLLLLGVMIYPYALEVGVSPFRHDSGGDLIGSPRPEHLTALFLPTLLVAAVILIIAVLPRRSPVLPTPTT